MAAATVVAKSTIIGNLKLLTYDNYEYWSRRVKTYLLAKDLWDVVEGTNEAPEPDDVTKIKAWRKKDAKTLYVIESCCGDATYALIQNATSAKEAWGILADKVQQAEEAKGRDRRSLSEAYPRTPVVDRDTELGNQSAVEDGRQGVEGAEMNTSHAHAGYVTFVKDENWNEAIRYLRQHPDAATTTFSGGRTALHLAILSKEGYIVRELVELMSPEALEIQEATGYTALCLLILWLPDRVYTARLMVEKCKRLLTIVRPGNFSRSPLLMAQYAEEGKKMARYLYSVTAHDTLSITEAAELVSAGFRLIRFGVAWDLIQKYPELTVAQNYSGRTPLMEVAGMHSAFLSRRSLNFWKQWIYDRMHVTPLRTDVSPSSERRWYRRWYESGAAPSDLKKQLIQI